MWLTGFTSRSGSWWFW